MKLKECVRSIGPSSSNERRDIYDLLDPDFPMAEHINVFRFKNQGLMPNVGGNHWHNASERFLIVAGEMPLLILLDRKTDEKRIWHNLGAGTVITIPGGIAHANILSSSLILVGALNRAFDPQDGHPYLLIHPNGELA
ncbi:MAG: hypothetical protein KGZ30_00565 [Anaplasmataceae bacterium]|nr:hypothetical protein [Anaplasmataceae bacterium]